MKLIGHLKNKVEKAENKEEARQIIRDAGMLLDDQEMDQVTGGGFDSYGTHCSFAFSKTAGIEESYIPIARKK